VSRYAAIGPGSSTTIRTGRDELTTVLASAEGVF